MKKILILLLTLTICTNFMPSQSLQKRANPYLEKPLKLWKGYWKPIANPTLQEARAHGLWFGFKSISTDYKDPFTKSMRPHYKNSTKIPPIKFLYNPYFQYHQDNESTEKEIEKLKLELKKLKEEEDLKTEPKTEDFHR